MVRGPNQRRIKMPRAKSTGRRLRRTKENRKKEFKSCNCWEGYICKHYKKETQSD